MPANIGHSNRLSGLPYLGSKTASGAKTPSIVLSSLDSKRATLDLTGLPPTVDEMAQFLADSSEPAYHQVVERLLASPHYGERWARHWLDVARYADSAGHEFDSKRAVWKYRDWVIAGMHDAIPIDDFFVDLFENALADNEILTEIRIATPGANSGGAYIKVERKVGDYAISAVAAQLTMNGDVCTAVRLGLTNVSPVPMRDKNAEAALQGKTITQETLDAAGQAAAAECDPSADLRGSVEYKRDLTRVLTKRAIRRAIYRV